MKGKFLYNNKCGVGYKKILLWTYVGKLNVDAGAVTLSGFSAGGAMANQLHVAHSSLFSGAAIFSQGRLIRKLITFYTKTVYFCVKREIRWKNLLIAMLLFFQFFIDVVQRISSNLGFNAVRMESNGSRIVSRMQLMMHRAMPRMAWLMISGIWRIIGFLFGLEGQMNTFHVVRFFIDLFRFQAWRVFWPLILCFSRHGSEE